MCSQKIGSLGSLFEFYAYVPNMSFSYPHYGALLRQQPILELLHGARKGPNGCPQAQLVDDTWAPRISNVRD